MEQSIEPSVQIAIAIVIGVVLCVFILAAGTSFFDRNG